MVTWFCFADEVMHEQIIAKISRGKSESLEDKKSYRGCLQDQETMDRAPVWMTMEVEPISRNVSSQQKR